MKLDATPARVGTSAPLLDEHTDEVLEELGFGPGDRARLRAEGVVGREQ